MWDISELGLKTKIFTCYDYTNYHCRMSITVHILVLIEFTHTFIAEYILHK